MRLSKSWASRWNKLEGDTPLSYFRALVDGSHRQLRLPRNTLFELFLQLRSALPC